MTTFEFRGLVPLQPASFSPNPAAMMLMEILEEQQREIKRQLGEAPSHIVMSEKSAKLLYPEWEPTGIYSVVGCTVLVHPHVHDAFLGWATGYDKAKGMMRQLSWEYAVLESQKPKGGPPASTPGETEAPKARGQWEPAKVIPFRLERR